MELVGVEDPLRGPFDKMGPLGDDDGLYEDIGSDLISVMRGLCDEKCGDEVSM
jgi:hypothetical protein